MLKQIIHFTLAIAFIATSPLLNADAGSILLREHSRTAITTDLEPDDVLALAILFDEANKIYETKGGEYPIALIVVGEGNTAIKRARLEKMLGGMIPLPPNVAVEIAEGQASDDNDFLYDGEEILDDTQLNALTCNLTKVTDGTSALQHFLAETNDPLIVVLKPPIELLSLDTALLNKSTALFYGSFNFRKALSDPQILQNPLFDGIREEGLPVKLQALLDFFAQHFAKIGIVESFSLLGAQASVFREHEWTHDIAQFIDNSETPFFVMFRQLVANWNRYLFDREVPYLKTALLSVGDTEPSLQKQTNDLLAQLDELSKEWDSEKFSVLYDEIMNLTEQHLRGASDANLIRSLMTLQRGIQFANLIRPDSGLQFTLADVCAALALVDNEGFFSADPVDLKVSKWGFLLPVNNPKSPILYYGSVDHHRFALILLNILHRIENL